MSPDVEAAITRAANEARIDPAFALAVADKESNGDPTAHSSKTIYGLYQMRGDLRKQYGGADADSSDPYTQAKTWTKFIGDTRAYMAARLGRQPTDGETYLGHYFGKERASNLIRNPALAVGGPEDVFSKQEIKANPNFGRASSIGALMGGITNDIGQRQAMFSQGASANLPQGAGTEKGPGTLDFGQFGQSAQPDFSQFGQSPDEARGAIPDVRPGLTIPGSAPVMPAALQPSAAPSVAGSPPGAPAQKQSLDGDTGGGSLGGPWQMTAAMAPNGIPGVEDWRPSTNIEDDRGLGAKLGMIGDRFMHNAKAIGAAVGIGGDNAQDNAETTPAPRPGVEVDLTPYTMNPAGSGTGW